MDLYSQYIFVFIFFLIVFVFYRRLDTAPSGRRGRTKGTGGEGKEKTGKQPYFSLALLSLVFCLSWIAYVQWTTTLSTYTQDIGISLEEYSFLWTVNGALIVLGQPLVALLVRYLAKSMKKQLVYGLAIFMGAFYLASVSRTFSGFLTAMVILTLGEMLVWPAIPAVADRLAPEGKRGLFQGIINSASAAGRMIGPVIGGVIVDHYGMGRLFSIMIFVFLIALFLVHFFDGSMKRGQKTKDMAAT
jgi:Major Facilitator Superfamily.